MANNFLGKMLGAGAKTGVVAMIAGFASFAAKNGAEWALNKLTKTDDNVAYVPDMGDEGQIVIDDSDEVVSFEEGDE